MDCLGARHVHVSVVESQLGLHLRPSERVALEGIVEVLERGLDHARRTTQGAFAQTARIRGRKATDRPAQAVFTPSEHSWHGADRYVLCGNWDLSTAIDDAPVWKAETFSAGE